MCTTPLVVVLIAGGLRVLKTQHVDGRAEGVPALARLGGVTAGRGGYGGAWGLRRGRARSCTRTSRWYSAVMRQPSRRMYISNSSTAASPAPCRAHSRASCLAGASRALCSAEGGGRGSAKGAAAGDQRAEGARGLRALRPNPNPNPTLSLSLSLGLGLSLSLSLSLGLSLTCACRGARWHGRAPPRARWPRAPRQR